MMSHVSVGFCFMINFKRAYCLVMTREFCDYIVDRVPHPSPPFLRLLCIHLSSHLRVHIEGTIVQSTYSFFV